MGPYPGSEAVPEDSGRSFLDNVAIDRANMEIVCCFNTLVCRVTAIDAKYPGGHKAFLEKHQGWQNDHIMVVHRRGDALRQARNDLEKYGIQKTRDWVQLDEDRVIWSWDMFSFDTRASWLKGRYRKGDIYVRYLQREQLAC